MQATITFNGSGGRELTLAGLDRAFQVIERTLKNHGFVVVRLPEPGLPNESITHGRARGNLFYLETGPVPRELGKESAWLVADASCVTLSFTMLESVGSL